MPPLERITHTALAVPSSTMPNSPDETHTTSKALVSPGGGAPPATLNRLEPEVGGTVLTLFGLARVLQVRSRGVIKCQLKGAGKKTLCILNESSYQVLSQAATRDLTASQLAQYALRLQSLAALESKRHHTGLSLQLYDRVLAVSTLLLKQRSLPQAQRGDWVIRSVKCSIAAAQLAIQLHLHPAALDFTKDALGVLDALERKRTTSPPSSPQRKPAEEEEETSSSSSSSGDSTDASSTSTISVMQDLGQVKLFGECRVKALLLTAQALLEMNQGKTLALAALRLLEQAQKILRKYTTKQYLEHREFKTTMKVFVSLQKDLKRLKKQAKLVIKPKVTVNKKDHDSGFTSWFRSRRVMFADDKKPDSPSRHVVVASKVMAAVTTSTSTWTRRDSLVLGGVVAGGLFAFHCMMRRQRL